MSKGQSKGVEEIGCIRVGIFKSKGVLGLGNFEIRVSKG